MDGYIFQITYVNIISDTKTRHFLLPLFDERRVFTNPCLQLAKEDKHFKLYISINNFWDLKKPALNGTIYTQQNTFNTSLNKKFFEGSLKQAYS